MKIKYQNTTSPPTVPYYLFIAGGSIIGFIRLLRVILLFKYKIFIQEFLSRFVVSIFYDDICMY